MNSIEGDVPDVRSLPSRPKDRQILIVTKDNHAFKSTLKKIETAKKLAKDALKQIEADPKATEFSVPFDRQTITAILWWMNNHTTEEDLVAIGDSPDEWINSLWDEWEYDFFNDTDGQFTLKLIRAAKDLGLKRFHALAHKRLWNLVNEKFTKTNPVQALRLSFNVPERLPQPDSGTKKPQSLDISEYFVCPTRNRLKRNLSQRMQKIEVSHMSARRQYCPEGVDFYGDRDDVDGVVSDEDLSDADSDTTDIY